MGGNNCEFEMVALQIRVSKELKEAIKARSRKLLIRPSEFVRTVLAGAVAGECPRCAAHRGAEPTI